jgi:uncharacterized protein YukE
MTLCDLDSGIGRLSRAFAELKERVVDVKSQWNDETLRQFEEAHLRELPARMQLLVTAVERLADFVNQAERECADERPE